MQKKDTAIEVKVGALVLLSLGLLVGFIMALGDFSLSEGLQFRVQFDNAGGLKPGADVAIAGINVGSVTGLSFIENDEEAVAKSGLTAVAVEAVLRVESRYANAVRENSEFFITTRGVLGEPYIEVVTSKLDAQPVQSGAVLRGVDPPRMDIIVARVSQLLDNLNEAVNDPDVRLKDLVANTSSLFKNLDELVSDNRDDIDATIEGVRVTSTEAAKLLTTINAALGDGEQLKGMMNDAGVTVAQARSIATKVNANVDPVLHNVRGASQSVHTISTTAEEFLLTNKEKLSDSMDNIHASTESLKSLSDDAQTVMTRVRDGEGTVGSLLAEREVYEDMKEIMRIIKRHPWKILWKE